MLYIFTEEGYKELQRLIENTRKKLEEVTKEKSEAHQGQDGWHDEGFKIGISREMLWSKRLRDLQEKYSQARVILNSDMIDQNEIALFGTGVIIEYKNGEKRKIVISGYQLSKNKNFKEAKNVYVYSPLGGAVFKKRVGDLITYSVKDKFFVIKIIKIISPFEISEFL